MHPQTFIALIDDEQVATAIQRAESLTSGELRVFISDQAVDDPVAEAQTCFEELGMAATAERNAVLIFLAPKSQTFAVVGDTAVHERCGDGFWREVADAMADRLRRGDYTAGIVEGVRRVGELLAAQFPRRPDDRNELPDAPVRG